MPGTLYAVILIGMLALMSPAAHAFDDAAEADKATGTTVNLDPRNGWATRSNTLTPGGTARFAEGAGKMDRKLAPRLFLKGQVALNALAVDEADSADQGALFERVYLEYSEKRFALRGGKFIQKFGLAWNAAPATGSSTFAQDYKRTEQIGAAAEYKFMPPDAGMQVLTLGIFSPDTTVLPDSLLSSRPAAEDTRNNANFFNYAVALEGGGLKPLPRLHYHLALISRNGDSGNESRETGFATALHTTFKLGAIHIRPLIEWVTLADRAGVAGADCDYLTTSAHITGNRWNFALSRTARDTRPAAAEAVDDSQVQMSVGYAVRAGVNLSAIFQSAEESGVVADSFGAVVQYATNF